MFTCVILTTSFILAPDQDTKSLQATWVAVKAMRNGKPAEDIVRHQLVFTASKFTITSKDSKVLFQGTYSVDAGTIDFRHTAGKLKGKTWKGIYSLDGNTLKICDNAEGLTKPRPKTFKATSGYVLVVFKRRK